MKEDHGLAPLVIAVAVAGGAVLLHRVDVRHSGPIIGALALAGILTGAFVVSRLEGRRTGMDRRRPLGVDANARFASGRALAPLRLRRGQRNRFVIGRRGRHLLATEDRSAARTRTRKHTGDRGAVCVIGPSRCGKTANTISGILQWDGPAILSSVKTDLLSATAGWRAQRGEVRVFDPTGATTATPSGWSPLGRATTPSDAQRIAHSLSEAAPRAGAENLDFFLALAEQLLWPCLYLASQHGAPMAEVARWMLVQDRPTPRDDGAIQLLLDRELAHGDATRRAAAVACDAALAATWSLDDRTRSSVYATAQTLVQPWTDPSVAASARTHDIDLDWLTSGSNTLYLCAPLHDQSRLAPVFGGLIGDLLQQAYARAGRNEPMPPTLLVLDEAGNSAARWLPEVASTCAGIGIVLVTIWQSKAQIDAAYGPLADSLLTNHLTKIVFSGVSDPATAEYVDRLLGETPVVHRGVTHDLADGRRSLGEDTRSARLVPAHVLRQVAPGEAVLVHGTLPPAHLRTIPYFRDRRLAARAALGGVP
ncbi:MAG: type IV secretory system conjugative DNA transfer family protein [Acidimicrobiia bacterium]